MSDAAYLSVEKLVHKVVWDFRKKHGGNPEDLLSIANLTYVKAHQSYDPTKGTKYSTYIATCIYRNLLKDKRKNKNRATESLTLTDGRQRQIEQPVVSPGFDFGEFCRDLTEDAKVIVSLVVDTPGELVEAVENKGGNIRNWRSSLRDYLKQLGWSSRRICKTFEEVKGVLA